MRSVVLCALVLLGGCRTTIFAAEEPGGSDAADTTVDASVVDASDAGAPGECVSRYAMPAADTCRLFVESDAIEADFTIASPEPPRDGLHRFVASVGARRPGIFEQKGRWRTAFSYETSDSVGELSYATAKPYVIGPLPETIDFAYLDKLERCRADEYLPNLQNVVRSESGELLLYSVRDMPLLEDGRVAPNAGLTPELQISWERAPDCSDGGPSEYMALRFTSPEGEAVVRPGARAAIQIGSGCYEILVSRVARPMFCGASAFALVRQDLLVRCEDGAPCP